MEFDSTYNVSIPIHSRLTTEACEGKILVMKRLGVFICHCGVNIAGTVDVKSVAEKMGRSRTWPTARITSTCVLSRGSRRSGRPSEKRDLNGVVVACCSPSMHENTFRKAVRSQGMNPYLCEIANIREQCSWVHQKEKEKATRKAAEIIQATLEKVRQNESLEAIAVAINRKVLVIGGGIAGITASLDLAEGGYEVILLEREACPGGPHGPALEDLSRSRSCPRRVCSQRHQRWRNIRRSTFTVMRNWKM